MSWLHAIAGLNRAVVRVLGEELLLDDGRTSARIRGVLTDPERLSRHGGADLMMAEAMLTLRASEAPAWLGRGVRILRATGTTYDVVRSVDNGEGLVEVTLCRSS